MKKSLLLLSVALMAVTSAFGAPKDPATYAKYGDLEIKNLWLFDRMTDATNYQKAPIANTADRMAVLYNGVVYVASSAADDPEVVSVAADGTKKPLECGTLYKYDSQTGDYLGAIKLTIDGARYTGLLCVNSVGVDNFGHLWVAPYNDANKTEFNVYSVDTATGAMTLQGTLSKGTGESRIDYIDVIGDITRAEANCSIVAPGASTAFIFGWTAEKGGEWEGLFAGDIAVTPGSFFPASATQWGYAPCAKIIPGMDDTAYSAENFYIDGFQSFPAIYDQTPEIIASFENVPEELNPKAGTNGVCEFSLNGKDFIAYSIAQPNDAGAIGAQINICELGEGMDIATMTKCWTIPEASHGQTSDGGTRIHCINREMGTDAQGNEYVDVLTYKNFNGLGVYRIGTNLSSGVEANLADNVAITVNGGVITVSAEASEIALYNVAGQLVAKVNNASEIAAPAAGAYIVKATVAGAPVVKKIVL